MKVLSKSLLSRQGCLARDLKSNLPSKLSNRNYKKCPLNRLKSTNQVQVLLKPDTIRPK